MGQSCIYPHISNFIGLKFRIQKIRESGNQKSVSLFIPDNRVTCYSDNLRKELEV